MLKHICIKNKIMFKCIRKWWEKFSCWHSYEFDKKGPYNASYYYCSKCGNEAVCKEYQGEKL